MGSAVALLIYYYVYCALKQLSSISESCRISYPIKMEIRFDYFQEMGRRTIMRMNFFSRVMSGEVLIPIVIEPINFNL